MSVHEILGLWPAGSGRLPKSCEMREARLCSINFKESLVFSGQRGGAPRQGDKLKALPGSSGRTAQPAPVGGGGWRPSKAHLGGVGIGDGVQVSGLGVWVVV